MKKCYLHISILFAFLISSQNIIDGYVYDESNSGIYNVEIYINNTTAGSITDSLGYFQLILPDNSEYLLSISHIGYTAQSINISASTSAELEIYLKKAILDVDQIVVTALGYKSYIKDTPVITHIITREEIHNSPYNSIRDIIEFAIPNVQRIHDPHGEDRIKIQGLDNKFVIFMIDGNRVSGEFAGNIDFSMISMSDIDRIEIVRSGMSTLYGSDSMGGIINIITKKNKKSISLNGSYTYDLPTVQTSSLTLNTNFLNFNYKLGIDYNDSPGYDLTDYSPVSKTFKENVHYKIKNSFSYDNDNISILIGDNHIQVKLENTIITTRIIKDPYPDYEGVIPTDNTNTLVVNKENFSEAIKRVAIFSNKSSRQVSIELSENRMTITTEDPENITTGKEIIDCNYDGEPMTIGYNAFYLKEVLQHQESEEIKIMLNSPLNAGLFVPLEQKDNDYKTTLLMPIRLND